MFLYTKRSGDYVVLYLDAAASLFCVVYLLLVLCTIVTCQKENKNVLRTLRTESDFVVWTCHSTHVFYAMFRHIQQASLVLIKHNLDVCSAYTKRHVLPAVRVHTLPTHTFVMPNYLLRLLL